MRFHPFCLIVPLAALAACATPERAPTAADTSGATPVPTEQVRDDMPRSATRSDAEKSRNWEGLGSTGGGTGTGVSSGTTAPPPPGPPAPAQ